MMIGTFGIVTGKLVVSYLGPNWWLALRTNELAGDDLLAG
jgi:hypothetical protein